MKNVDRRQSLRGPHFQQTLPEVTLEIARGNAHRRLRHVKPPVFLIGAAADCDLVLGDPQFPSVHTYLYVTKAGVSVRHIGDGPELMVNGEAVESSPIADGDRLLLGTYEFIVRVHGQPTGDERGSRTRAPAYAGGNAESDFDPNWEHLQMLMADLPAPLRPSSIPAWRPASATDTIHIYERRAIA